MRSRAVVIFELRGVCSERETLLDENDFVIEDKKVCHAFSADTL